MKPVTPKKTNDPVQYHCYDSCNRCGDVNDFEGTSTDGGHMSECKTKCKKCGFTDYWAHGFFESSTEMESKCAKYSFS